MNDLREQRLAVKFCVKPGDSATETFAMLNTAYGDVAIKCTACFKWYERFKGGRQSIEDDERPVRPSTSTDDPHVHEINTLVWGNRRLIIRELAEECGISVGSCYKILTEKLRMHRVAAKFVLRLMTEDQKANRVRVCQELLDRSEEDEDFFSMIITGDESWVYGYDVETKVQSSQWVGETSPRPKKARQVRSNVKVMLTVFFDAKGIVHHEYLPQGSTVNQTYYIEILKRRRDAIRRKRPEMWRSGDWFFYQRSSPFSPQNSGVLGQTFDHCSSPPPLLT
ncbi:protein GVQW3-like [Ornithodoros turicata]|uniref:protein GVQW3-like n=1 Tax=Ornithodoros turicata TaxID=34597 RepID=UPI003138EA90